MSLPSSASDDALSQSSHCERDPVSSVKTSPATPSTSPWIIGPWSDALFLIGSPVVAVWVIMIAQEIEWLNAETNIGPVKDSPIQFFIGVLIMSHLFLVFYRSHLNPKVTKQFKFRFFVVPPLLVIGMMTSPWISVSCSVLATWWDVYHSSLQTFGLGRMYDARVGNDAHVGRRLDIGLNLILYTGPILGGATLMDHVEDFDEFQEVGDTFFTAIPAYASESSQTLTTIMLTLGIGYLIYYLYAYYQLSLQGYRVSPLKIALLVITGICSLMFWGFNTFGEAFFVMNFFHAVQYFALVWWAEKKNLTRLSDRVAGSTSQLWVFVLFMALAISYGVWAELTEAAGLSFAVMTTVSLLHFWYDGFIWSVRKQSV